MEQKNESFTVIERSLGLVSGKRVRPNGALAQVDDGTRIISQAIIDSTNKKLLDFEYAYNNRVYL